MLRIGTPEARAAIAAGAKHADWKVRRLAVNLLRHYQINGAADVAQNLLKDPDPAVRLEAALSTARDPEQRVSTIRENLMGVLQDGVAADRHLRYEAAWHLAKFADVSGLGQLLSSEDADVRLAGLIAIDVACYENFPSKQMALQALAKALENPGKLDQQLLLMVAHLDGDASIVSGLEKLIAREDVPLSTTAKAILVLKAKAGGLSKGLSAAAGKRLIEAVDKGAVKIASPADQLMLFEFLESEGPTPFALKQIGGQLRSNQPALRQAAHVLARKFGPTSRAAGRAALAGGPRPRMPSSRTPSRQLSTVARIEGQPRRANWEKLLSHPDPLVRTEAVRWWRNFRGNSGHDRSARQPGPRAVEAG